jgi:hypothetical protein
VRSIFLWPRTHTLNLFSLSFYRVAIYSAVYEIHRAGVIAQPNCATRNADGRLRIFDFIDAERRHNCPGHKNCKELKSLRRLYGFSKCYNQQFLATLTDSPVVTFLTAGIPTPKQLAESLARCF